MSTIDPTPGQVFLNAQYDAEPSLVSSVPLPDVTANAALTFVRLAGDGWGNFTGVVGRGVPFEDGVSTRAVTRRELDHLAACMRVETVDGEQVGIQTRLKDYATVEAPGPEAVTLALQSEDEKAAEQNGAPNAEELKKAEGVRFYTGDELEEIALKDGIKGLREIAQPRGLKGRSIVELLKEIAAHQESLAPAKAPEGEATKTEAPAQD